MLGWYSKDYWRWKRNTLRPTLESAGVVRAGWYMMTVRIKTEQKRFYCLFNLGQGRMLITGQQRRRLVRVRGNKAYLEIYGLNGIANNVEMRLVRQTSCSARQKMLTKLKSLHPAYQSKTTHRVTIEKLWLDYNRLLNKRRQGLVGYDEWIEKVERPKTEFYRYNTQEKNIHFMVWLHGERQDSVNCRRSIQSIESQVEGNFTIADPAEKLDEKQSSTWVLALEIGDTLAPSAMRFFSDAIAASQDAAVIYSDEDIKTTSGRRQSPHFKPAWNQDLFYTDPRYSNSWCIRGDICLQVCEGIKHRGGHLSLRDLVLEATDIVTSEQIIHIPSVLYHRYEDFTNRDESQIAKAVLKSFMTRRQIDVTIETVNAHGLVLKWPLPAEPPLVSIIIPTRDCGDLLKRCITSIINHDDGKVPFEIIVVDNDSTEKTTLDYLDKLTEKSFSRVVRSPGPFNYSQINNRAVERANGKVLLFLNNDVEAMYNGWLAAMTAHAIRPQIGAVGAKLLYGDHTVQHGGVILGIGGVAGHAHKYFQAGSGGYQRRLQLTQNVSAVTAAALAIKKSLFIEIGGFDEEHLKVNYNDVDLCLRVLKAGYRNLFCAEAVLIHHESKTRGFPVEGQPQYHQWQEERKVMQARWASHLAHDPCYSPHLSLTEEDFSIRMNNNINTMARTCFIPF